MASYATRRRLTGDHVRQVRRCESQKVGFPTRAAALDAAERLMEQGRVYAGCHITPYRCDTCPDWHVANRRIVRV